MPEGMQLRGNPGRRPRLSDAETERRMLDAGRRSIGRYGLSLSLEHLNMEELIADSGVSRTSSYRRWPTKDAFAADLLLHSAENTRMTADFAPYADAVRSLDPSLWAHLDTEQGRRDAIVEVFRVLLDADLRASLGSPSWRSYVVLRAAHAGLPDGELRDRIAAALRETERGFVGYRARVMEAASQLMGYRLKDPASLDWHSFAEVLSATFTGLGVRAFSDPDAVTATAVRAPFGSSRTAAWSTAALAGALVYFGAAEPDPDVVWDAPRVAAATRALTDIDRTLAALWDAGGAAEDRTTASDRDR